METAKYVMFDWPTCSYVPILFPPCVRHSDIVKMVKEVYPGVEPISAGFVEYDKESNKMRCYDESTTLKLSCENPRDTNLINIMFDRGY